MWPRVTIARLLAVILCCGAGFAALRSPSQLWASTLFAVALGSLPVAAVNAVYGRGRRRAFWVGFLVCGGSYFMATLGPWFRDEFGPRMVTTAALDLLYVEVSPPPPAPIPIVRSVGGVNPGERDPLGTVWEAWTVPDRGDGVGYQVGQLALASTAPFRRIGHALLTLLFGTLGGLYARHRCAAEGPGVTGAAARA